MHHVLQEFVFAEGKETAVKRRLGTDRRVASMIPWSVDWVEPLTNKNVFVLLAVVVCLCVSLFSCVVAALPVPWLLSFAPALKASPAQSPERYGGKLYLTQKWNSNDNTNNTIHTWQPYIYIFNAFFNFLFACSLVLKRFVFVALMLPPFCAPAQPPLIPSPSPPPPPRHGTNKFRRPPSPVGGVVGRGGKKTRGAAAETLADCVQVRTHVYGLCVMLG